MEAIVSVDDFETVQRLLKTDGRACQEKGAVNVYYICSTKNRGEGCSRHSIEEDVLKGLLGTAVCE